MTLWRRILCSKESLLRKTYGQLFLLTILKEKSMRIYAPKPKTKVLPYKVSTEKTRIHLQMLRTYT